MTRVFLFPGQGSQAVGMGRALAEAVPVAMETFEEAEDILGLPVRSLCWEGPEETLRATENAQVALFVTSLAALRAYRAMGGPDPTITSGHSLGEYSAVCAAGALGFEETLRIVRRRGELMARAEAGTMAAVLGLPAEALEGICREVSGPVVIANYNSPDQLVISGSPEAVAAASALATERGAKRVVPLAVAGAFHSPLMEVAGADLATALARAPWQDSRVPVLTNVDARPTTEAGEFAAKLSRQLASPVRWSEAMGWALARGDVTFIEMGAGKVLSGLVKKHDRKAPTHTTEDPDALAKTLAALEVRV